MRRRIVMRDDAQARVAALIFAESIQAMSAQSWHVRQVTQRSPKTEAIEFSQLIMNLERRIASAGALFR
jgi:hypothetical protein